MAEIDKILEFIAENMTTGTNSIEIGDFLIQWGVDSMTLEANGKDSKTIFFAKDFESTPVVFAQMTIRTNFPANWVCGASPIDSTRFSLAFQNQYTSQTTITCNWIAFGKAKKA